MEYKTNLTSTIGVFHEFAAVSKIESAIGRAADRATNRGDMLPNNKERSFERSSAYFEVGSNSVESSEAAIGECLAVIEGAGNPAFLRQCEIWIILGLNDFEFAQVAVPRDLVLRLSNAEVALAIENRF
jgi:hypothetical protein